MEDRKGGVKDRRRVWKPTNNLVSLELRSDPARTGAGAITGSPAAWQATPARGHFPYPRLVRATIDASASTLNGPAMQNGPGLLHQLPLRLVGSSLTNAPRLRTVLLVDDNHLHGILLLRALCSEGYDVLHAADGARGEALSRSALGEIDALIACAEMKRMSGLELARRIRRARPEIAVLLMGRFSMSGAHSLFDRGFPVIEEPFTTAELTYRLSEVLAESRSTDWPESR
jgi:CheY-like chemotaxis protein